MIIQTTFLIREGERRKRARVKFLFFINSYVSFFFFLRGTRSRFILFLFFFLLVFVTHTHTTQEQSSLFYSTINIIRDSDIYLLSRCKNDFYFTIEFFLFFFCMLFGLGDVLRFIVVQLFDKNLRENKKKNTTKASCII